MSTAIINTRNQVNQECVDKLEQEIRQARIGRAAEHSYRALAGRIDQLSNLVERDWSSFSSEQKDILKDLAYSLTKPRKFNIWISLAAAWAAFRTAKQGCSEALLILLDAHDRLVDAILSAIEQDSLSQSDVDFDAFDGSCSVDNVVQENTSEDIGGWLRRISDRAMRET